MNGTLNKSLVNPWLATSLSFLLVLFLAIGLFACMPRPLPAANDIAQMPWWAPLGGVTGAVAVFEGLLLIQKLGAGPVNRLTITANLITSLLIDHFGLLRMEVHSLNPYCIAGAMIMIAGVTLSARF